MKRGSWVWLLSEPLAIDLASDYAVAMAVLVAHGSRRWELGRRWFVMFPQKDAI